MDQKTHGVLIADDYEIDRFFFKEAIRLHAPRLRVVGEVESGQEVVNYLSGEGQYADRDVHPVPELLILDVRLPGRSGMDVLTWLQKHDYPHLKVALLSESSSIPFRAKALEMGLQHIYTEFREPRELVQMVRMLQAELEKGGDGRFV